MFTRSILSKLKKWADNPGRKPLILRGARQVGKTTIINEFGQTFKQYIYLNLETKIDKVAFQTSLDIHRLVQSIFLIYGKQITEKANTLIFIDEIQEYPDAINMLRYFYEAYPEIRVVAAGSLLETIFNSGRNFPVGRVDYMVMRPFSFPEFLDAIGESMALEQLENIPLNDFAHDHLLRLFHTYAVIGGMPEIIQRYARDKDITALSPIYERLIVAYHDDVEKYGKNDHWIRIIRYCIRTSFIKAGYRIKFQRFGESDYSSREVGEALRKLEQTFLLSLLYPTINATLPITPDLRKSPRLQVLDTGIMNHFLGIQAEILSTSDLNQVYQGTIIEHLVGQELLACQFSPLSQLHFWVREKSTATAEVDYVYPFESQLIPIEVKSGKEGTLRSLHLFMDQTSHDMAIRFYAGPLSLTQAVTPSGKPYRLLNLPYYLATQIERYIEWLKNNPTSPRDR
ncbi:MAG: ATP-binding protein [Chitinophagaceae bacterium]|nr:ATP-binding protein [Chitinophagaceae bacterium]